MGLMLSTYAEKGLEDGNIVLVPDLKDAASQDNSYTVDTGA